MITAIILAAGKSIRMGSPKMLLPWGDTTVLGKVLSTFQAAGIDDLLVISGGDREEVEAAVAPFARTVFNPEFANGEMLSSVQCGLRNLDPTAEAVLITPGDQPLVRESSVTAVLRKYHESKNSIVVPSYLHRRGHPWLASSVHWREILRLRAPSTLRDFLTSHAGEITYIDVNDPGVLQDLDTPEDYARHRNSFHMK
jgi:molybdenum cofactor cytidylyltransferase